MLNYNKAKITIKLVNIFIKNIFCFNNLKSLSLKNNMLDLIEILKKNEKKRYEYYLTIEKELQNMLKEFKSYDYGQGYFYQSFKRSFIRGFRNTEERVRNYNLKQITSNKEVLDVGCNSGFILLSLSDIKTGLGIDINPYLINIAETTKDFLKVENIFFKKEKIENFKEKKKFDIVLSLANHSTIDGNISISKKEYFSKCASLLKTKGLLFFESHPKQIENNEMLKDTINNIEKKFKIISNKENNLSGFLDKNRTIILAEKK